MIDNYPIGARLICPVCLCRFTLGDEHKYIVHNHYTCSWKCFISCKGTINDSFTNPVAEDIVTEEKKLSYYQRHKTELAEKRKARNAKPHEGKNKNQ